MKKSRDTQKGITLVALVVTIIVLLILAMVSIKIGMDKGLIGKATETKSIEMKQEEKEKLTLAYSEYQIGKNNNSKYTMQNALNNINANATANGDDMLGYNVVFAKTNNEYTITASGEIIEGIANRWDGKSKESPLITEDKNWHISTAAQLKYFADYVNGTLTEEEKDGIELTETTTVYLEKDIDLGARVNESGEKLIGEEWIPIGQTNDLKFIGVFDGQNHYISGVYVNVDGKFGGIFGNANTIKNLTVKDSYIEAKRYVGGIVGAARSGSIENCINQNTKVVVAESSAGGIVGQTVGEVKNCTNNGSVLGRGGNERSIYCAGIAGAAIRPTSNITNCINTGKISIYFKEKYNESTKLCSVAAGIASANAGSISNCINIGEISVVSPNWWNIAGGIIGQNANNKNEMITIEDCTNSGRIYSNGLESSYFVLLGGMIGDAYNKFSLTECYNCGDIEGRKGSYMYEGGIIGRIQYVPDEMAVEKCFSNGSVMGYEAKGRVQAGGIIGDFQTSLASKVKKSYYYDKNNNIKGALKYDDYPDNEVKKIDQNFKSLEEFLNWLNSKK